MKAKFAKKIMKRAAEASTGLAVVVAFFNVALLVTELVKTVTEYEPVIEDEEAPVLVVEDAPEL